MRAQLSFVAWLWIVAAALPAGAQDRLAEAKTLYDEAMYTQALDILEQDPSLRMQAEAHHYRALCLIALGRSDAAERAMADVVIADPFFRPDARATSPKVAALFAATRRRLLPPTIRRGFAEATSLYREGARARSRERFDDVLRLLDDPALEGDQALADLALVAGAFVELTRAQAGAPDPSAEPAAPAVVLAAAAGAGPDPVVSAAAATAAPAPAAAVTAAPAGPAEATAPTPASAPATVAAPELIVPIATAPAIVAAPAAAPSAPASAAVVVPAEPPSPAPADTPALPPGAFAPPVALEQTFPKWTPRDDRWAGRTYQGAILVSIDQAGRVTSATQVRTIHPAYDPLVLDAARTWVYRPALRNGRPVASELVVEVTLRPSAS